MYSLSISSILLFAFALYLALKLLRRRRKRKPPRRVRTEVDRWIDESLARELSRKLGLERELLQRALEGSPDPDAVDRMEEAVRAMQVKYARHADRSIDVRLDLTFEDGTTASTSRQFSADKVPSAIKDEFARTGGSYVFRAVYFPWSSPE